LLFSVAGWLSARLFHTFPTPGGVFRVFPGTSCDEVAT